MQTDLIEALLCPRSGQRLDVEPLEASGAEIEYGVLSSEAGVYPIVSGIPVFLPGHEPVVDLLREGRFAEATSVAAFGGLPKARLTAALSALASDHGVGMLARAVATALDRRRRLAGVRALLAPSHPGAALDVVRFAYLDSPGRSVDAFNYFAFRYSMPRHLVGLACIEAAPQGAGPILDLGCGAGHLTWPLQTRMPDRQVVGVDKTFFLLFVARRDVARGAAFVCADASALPFAPEHFSLLLASDVLSFVTDKWPVAREMDRVLEPGGALMLTSVKNRLCAHVYAGEPLSPDGWRRVVDHLDHRLLPDGLVLQRYLEGRGLPPISEAASTEVRASPTISVLATKGGEGFGEDVALDGWPHARGALGVNPLFHPTSTTAGEIVYERRFPSQAYAEDNPEMAAYLPERVRLPIALIDEAAGGGRPPQLEPFIRSLSVLGFPPGFLPDPWPRPAVGTVEESPPLPV